MDRNTNRLKAFERAIYDDTVLYLPPPMAKSAANNLRHIISEGLRALIRGSDTSEHNIMGISIPCDQADRIKVYLPTVDKLVPLSRRDFERLLRDDQNIRPQGFDDNAFMIWTDRGEYLVFRKSKRAA